MMKLHLGGHLPYFEIEQRAWLEFALTAPIQLKDILNQAGIPLGEIYLTVVNSEAVDLENAWVKAGDRVEVYPPMGGG